MVYGIGLILGNVMTPRVRVRVISSSDVGVDVDFETTFPVTKVYF